MGRSNRDEGLTNVGIGVGIGVGSGVSKSPIPYSPANDMLWLVYFLGVRSVLNGGGIVHKRFESHFHQGFPY